MAGNRQPYVKRENRLVREWLAAEHPTTLQWKNVRLGPIPNTADGRLYSGIRRWADMVLMHDNTVYIVEAKMRPMPDALAQLEIYLRLWPQTPEFTQYRDLPVKGIYLTTRPDALVSSLAAEKGIEYVVFNPPWVEQWWREVIARGK